MSVLRAEMERHPPLDHKKDTRQKILKTAAHLFNQKGFSVATIEGIMTAVRYLISPLLRTPQLAQPPCRDRGANRRRRPTRCPESHHQAPR